MTTPPLDAAAIARIIREYRGLRTVFWHRILIWTTGAGTGLLLGWLMWGTP